MQPLPPGSALWVLLALPGPLAACGARSDLGVGMDVTDPRQVVALSSSAADTCALRADGSVVCWGNRFGKPIDVALHGAVEIAVGLTRACTRMRNGHVVCLPIPLPWNQPVGAPLEIPGIGDALHISVGPEHACAVTESVALACWGSNYNGLLGNGSQVDSVTPVAANVDVVDSVSAGEFETCAITRGSIQCWGRALAGALGGGKSDYPLCDSGEACSPTPVAVIAIDDPRQVSAGLNGACAIDGVDGKVKCWGWHSSTFDLPESDAPRVVQGAGAATRVFAGYTRACAILTDGRVRCWGDNTTGALGNGTTDSHAGAPVEVAGLGDVVEITGGWYHTCALRAGGEVLCWGDNGLKQLGEDGVDIRLAPGLVPL